MAGGWAKGYGPVRDVERFGGQQKLGGGQALFGVGDQQLVVEVVNVDPTPLVADDAEIALLEARDSGRILGRRRGQGLGRVGLWLWFRLRRLRRVGLVQCFRLHRNGRGRWAARKGWLRL